MLPFPGLCQNVRKSFGDICLSSELGRNATNEGSISKTAITRYNSSALYLQNCFQASQLPAGPTSLFWIKNYSEGESSLIFYVSPIWLHECAWRPGSNWWHSVGTMSKLSEKKFWRYPFWAQNVAELRQEREKGVVPKLLSWRRVL